jgi:hypothetical protein
VKVQRPRPRMKLLGAALTAWALREIYGIWKDRAGSTSSKLDKLLATVIELKTDYRAMKKQTAKDIKAAHDRIRALERGKGEGDDAAIPGRRR